MAVCYDKSCNEVDSIKYKQVLIIRDTDKSVLTTPVDVETRSIESSNGVAESSVGSAESGRAQKTLQRN
jgi:hypothetical protein